MYKEKRCLSPISSKGGRMEYKVIVLYSTLRDDPNQPTLWEIYPRSRNWQFKANQGIQGMLWSDIFFCQKLKKIFFAKSYLKKTFFGYLLILTQPHLTLIPLNSRQIKKF